MATVNDDQVLRAAEGDYSTPEWPIGGILKLYPQGEADWILESQWGQRFLLNLQGLKDLAAATAGAAEPMLPNEPGDIDALWDALNLEIQTRQKCAGDLNGRLDTLAERVSEVESAIDGSLGID